MHAEFLPHDDEDEEEIGSPIPDDDGWVRLEKERGDASEPRVVRGKQGGAGRRKPKRRGVAKGTSKRKANKRKRVVYPHSRGARRVRVRKSNG